MGSGGFEPPFRGPRPRVLPSYTTTPRSRRESNPCRQRDGLACCLYTTGPVGPDGVEPPFPTCKDGVIPLHYEPMRSAGIGPAPSAWKAGVLPLHHDRDALGRS